MGEASCTPTGLLQPLQIADHKIQILAADVLHRVEVNVVLGTDLKHRNDVCMVKPTRRSRFPEKSLQVMVTSRRTSVQDLECDSSTHRAVFSFIDDSHAAATELFDNAVLAELRWSRDHRDRADLVFVVVLRSEILQHRQRAKHVADLVRQMRMHIGVLTDLRPFAVAQPIKILLREGFDG